jgi:PAS domain S-box-containing protein
MEIASKSIWDDSQEGQCVNSLNNIALVSITDPDNIIIYVNQSFCDYTGYDEQELLGRNHCILKSDKQPDSMFKELWATISSKNIWKGELCNKRKDGSFHWSNTTIVPFIDKNGDIEKYVAIRFDITKDKENIENLKIVEKKFKLLFDSAPDAYFICDLEGVIINCNIAAEKLSGYTKEELINNKISDATLISEADKTLLANSIRVPSKKPHIFEFQTTTKDNKKIVAELISHHAVIEGKNVVLNIARDITKHKITTNNLQEKSKELEMFLYRSSHDLRAPFTSLEGLLNLIKQEDLSKSTIELVKMFEETLNNGKLLVDNLATSSETFNTTLKNERVDLNKIIKQTLIKLNHIEGFKNISFNINIAKEFIFYSNKEMLRSIFQILLQNAINYQRPSSKTHTPFIIINALKTKEGVKITIKDNGKGIKKNEVDKIFDLYYRSNNTVDGTGLGLYITKNAVEKLNGSISATSIINKETQFDILLPNLFEA